MLYITNKKEHSSFQSGCVVRVLKRLIYSIAVAIGVLINFILLLKFASLMY